MAITTVLFDLDGMLLPMDQDRFLKAYLGKLSMAMAPHGYAPEKLLAAIGAGIHAMVKNNGSSTNEEAFWQVFIQHFGPQSRADEPLFDAFYHTEFPKLQPVCGHSPRAGAIVRWLKEKGIRVALATNPLFPAIATRQRIVWAGLTPEDFEIVTTYENASFCKPNIKYYEAIVNEMGVDPSRCLMVGNDVGEDMVAADLGMQVFLLTDCLINKNEQDISQYPHGDMAALEDFLKSIL